MIMQPGGARLSRRDLLRLAAVGGAAVAVGGCGGGGGGGSTSVSWQAIPSYSLQGTDPARVDYLNSVLVEFEAESGVDIQPEVASGDTVAAMAKLQLQAAEGRAPDVAQVDGYLFGGMAEHAQPLTGQLEAAGLRVDDWFTSLHPVMTAGDSTVRSLPFTTDVRVLYYRRDLVPTPPATWDELIAIARPLAEQGREVLFPGGRSEGAVATTLWPQFWAHDLELFDDSGNATFGDGPGYAAMRDSLGVVERLVAAGVSPSRVATFGKEDDLNADVVADRVAMFLGGSWQAAALDNALPSNDFFDTWAAAPIPSISGERHASTAGGWVWAAFSDDQAEADAGIAWVTKAFVSDAGMAAWCTAGGYLPPRQSVYDNPAYEQNPFTSTFREHLGQYAKTRPGDPGYVDVSASLQIALSNVASGTTGAAQALDEALTRIV